MSTSFNDSPNNSSTVLLNAIDTMPGVSVTFLLLDPFNQLLSGMDLVLQGKSNPTV